MTTFRLDKNGYCIRRSLPKWLVVAHIAGLIIASYAVGYPYA
jgi:hypothetical protein